MKGVIIMEDNRNEIVVNEDGTVEDSEKLTKTDKLILGGTCIGIGTAGYLLGTYVIAPFVRKLKRRAELEMAYEKVRQEASRGKKKKKSESGVDYDEDFFEVDDEEESNDNEK
jgi:hypothetical protein